MKVNTLKLMSGQTIKVDGYIIKISNIHYRKSAWSNDDIVEIEYFNAFDKLSSVELFENDYVNVIM